MGCVVVKVVQVQTGGNFYRYQDKMHIYEGTTVSASRRQIYRWKYYTGFCCTITTVVIAMPRRKIKEEKPLVHRWLFSPSETLHATTKRNIIACFY